MSAASFASPTVQHGALVAAFLARVTRPCAHDPADLREEREGIVCAECGLSYRAKPSTGAP